MTQVLEIEGFDELLNYLSTMPDRAQALLDDAMGEALDAIKARVRPYPPQPPRDRARTFNTYVRGIGDFPLSAFVEGRRKLRGAYAPGPRGGRVRYTSEDLGNQWSQSVRATSSGVIGTIGNPVSYAEYVQGEKQPAYHDVTGWVTLDDALDRAAPEIEAAFQKALDRLVSGFGDRR